MLINFLILLACIFQQSLIWILYIIYFIRDFLFSNSILRTLILSLIFVFFLSYCYILEFKLHNFWHFIFFIYSLSQLFVLFGFYMSLPHLFRRFFTQIFSLRCIFKSFLFVKIILVSFFLDLFQRLDPLIERNLINSNINIIPILQLLACIFSGEIQIDEVILGDTLSANQILHDMEHYILNFNCRTLQF